MRVLAAVFCALGPLGAQADITAAQYRDVTNVYGHGAVEGGEYAGLEVHLSDGRVLGTAAHNAVYEDTAPRLVDLNGDGNPEVITVVSGFQTGASIRIWSEVETADQPLGSTVAVVAENDPIGTRNRWLAIAGAADIDGDGVMEIAYVDRPHLAKTLRILEVRVNGNDWELVPEASMRGVTNHRFGDRFIIGGIRECGSDPEIIVASADWTRLLAVRYGENQFTTQDLGPYSDASMQDAMGC